MIVWSINSMNFVLGISAHKYMPPPAPAPVGIVPHLEGGVPMGFSMLFRKISDDVLFDGRGAVKMGHDVGFLIPHYNILPPAPPNALLAVYIPFSSCKVTYGQSKVLVNGTPAGAWFPVLQNCLDCGDPVKLPGGFLVDAAFRNTVVFKFNWFDFFVGLGYTLFEIGTGYLYGKLAGKLGGAWLSNALGQRLGYVLGQQLLGRLGVELSEVAVEKAIEKAYSTLLQKTVLKWLINEPIGNLFKHAGTEPEPPSPQAAPHDAIVDAAPLVNGPDAGPAPPGDAGAPVGVTP